MSRLIALVRHPAWALAAIALALGAPAQDKPAEQKRLFFDTVQVNLISVDVFVTDRAGRPVTGLQREDFEVFEDGHPVNVTNFFAADPSVPTLSPVSVADALGELPSGEPNLPPVEQRLSVVLLVDNSGITEAERNLALRNAREMLADCLRLPHTQGMVVMLDVRAHIRQTFTSDTQLLDTALDKLEREPADRTAGAINTSMIERAMSRISLPPQFSGQGLGSPGGRIESRDFAEQEALSILQSIRSSAAEARERTRATLVSTTDFIGSLAGLPGRKVVFYVGNGLSLNPGESLFMKWQSRFGQAGLERGFSAPLEAMGLSLSSDFRNLVARANSGRVTFYAIDASGGIAPGAVSAEQAVIDPEPGLNTSEAMGRQHSMQHLAFATGGEAIAAAPDPTATLARLLKDFDTYYSLAYPAPRIGDGRDHSITVKVRRDGAKVRYRRHYLDKTADDRVAERNLSALLHDSGSNSLEVEVRVGTPVSRGGGTFSVPLLVSVPVGKLVLLPEGDTHRGSVTIFLAAKDLDDRITPPVKRHFSLSVPNSSLVAALGQTGSYTFELVMARGPQTVAVSVRDDLAQTESTVTARFWVGERTDQPKTIQGRLM
jgi:VWFA-related protein